MRAPAPVPGHLRLRFTQLKQHPEKLDSIAASLQAVDGVLALETSALTGGLLIQFDAVIGNTPAFWNHIEAVLHSFQLMVNPRPLARQHRGAGGSDTPSRETKSTRTRPSKAEPEPLARRQAHARAT